MIIQKKSMSSRILVSVFEVLSDEFYCQDADII